MSLDEARELVNGPLWAKVRDDFLASGEFRVYPVGDERRMEYLDDETRKSIDLWLKAIPQIAVWRKVIDGKVVRQLRADYPDVYPEVLRYEAYFNGMKARVEGEQRSEILKILLKVRFPEAYKLCYS